MISYQDLNKLHDSREALLAAMREIAKGEGRFSRDPLAYAENTIEDMKAIASEAIAKAEGAT